MDSRGAVTQHGEVNCIHQHRSLVFQPGIQVAYQSTREGDVHRTPLDLLDR